MSTSFEYYKIFYYVAKYQNITLAAHALYLTQPTVSHYIQALEESLGFTLFVRTKKGVILTPEAQLLYEHVEKACMHLFKGEEELLAKKALTHGHLRIGASEMTLHNYLMPYLETFRKDYPNIKVKISSHSTFSAIDALKKGMVDFAIVISPIEAENTLEVTPLETFQDIIIAGNHYHFLHQKPISLKELTNYPLICMEHGTTTRKFLDHFFMKHQLLLEPDIELATTDLIAPMVEHNLGIGFVPRNFACQGLETGKLFEITLKEKMPTRQICLVGCVNFPLSLAAQKFVSLLKH